MKSTFLLSSPTYALLSIFILFSCDNRPSEKDGSETALLQVVATTGMIADAARNIAPKDLVSITALMGPGVDPHLYKATQGDLQQLMKADLILYNGLHLEGKMGDVLSKLNRTRSVVAVSEAAPKDKLRKSPQFQSTYDPHIWFDVALWKHAVNAINTSLQKAIPDKASLIQKNTEHYLTQLDSLHIAVREAIATIPERQRVLITAHDAFGYFGDAYAMEVKGLQGISTLSEFGLKDRSELVKFILKRRIKAIFVETSVSQRAIRSVMEDCREEGMNVVIGGSLFSDAMGEEGSPEGTYIGMVHANVSKIVEALK